MTGLGEPFANWYRCPLGKAFGHHCGPPPVPLRENDETATRSAEEEERRLAGSGGGHGAPSIDSFLPLLGAAVHHQPVSSHYTLLGCGWVAPYTLC